MNHKPDTPEFLRFLIELSEDKLRREFLDRTDLETVKIEYMRFKQMLGEDLEIDEGMEKEFDAIELSLKESPMNTIGTRLKRMLLHLFAASPAFSMGYKADTQSQDVRDVLKEFRDRLSQILFKLTESQWTTEASREPSNILELQ